MALLNLLLLLLLLLHQFQFRLLLLLLLVLNPPAHALLRLGHRRNGRELLHHGVVPERALDREGGVTCLDTAVLALQQFDLLVQQILRQLIRILNSGPLEHFSVTSDRALFVQRWRGHGRLVATTELAMVVTVGLVMMMVGQLLRRYIVLGCRLWQVHVTTGSRGHGTASIAGRSSAEATAGITACAGTTGQDTTTTTGMMMVCRVNLGWTIDLLWKTQYRRMVLRMCLRLPLPARVAHHRNMPRLCSDNPSHSTPPIPHINNRSFLLTPITSPTATMFTTSVAHHTPVRAMAMPMTMMVVTVIMVVIAVIPSRITCSALGLQVQTIQLFTQIVIATVLVRIVPEVPVTGSARTRRTERILVPELLAITAIAMLVEVLPR